MKKMILVSAVCLLLASANLHAAPKNDVYTPIHQFIDGFNSGDTKSAFAAFIGADVMIVDEFSPFRWYGPHAEQDWAAAYDKHDQDNGVTDGLVAYSDATRTEIDGDFAYVVIPTVYFYKEKGAPMKEEGQMTFVLLKESGKWRISAWTWTGVKPHPAS